MNAAIKSGADREVLYVAGCGLVGFGLFPFLHAYYNAYTWPRWHAGNEDSSNAFHIQHVVHPSTQTAFDLFTCIVSVMFALVGASVMLLSCLVLPKQTTRVCLKTGGAPLAVIAMGAAMLVYSIYAQNDVAAAWKASILRQFDAPQLEQLENRVNQVYCHAYGTRVCHEGALADAKALFTTLETWPRAETDQVRVRESCQGFGADAAVWQHGVPDAMKICRICGSIERDPMSEGIDLLDAIPAPHKAAVEWCGEYLITQRSDVKLANAPYQQHKKDVLDRWDKSPTSLTASAQLLVVLLWFSIASIFTMVHWYVTPEDEWVHSAATASMGIVV
uniref:Uncharacterized protein n=1 Tax=Globisporangium ultimum (strain ATCC 200006 / CBS 805.95 / DAOM BR144) TaxID=431595 RepID=K3WMA5_GLOUD